jgi:dihydropteroate synthase
MRARLGSVDVGEAQRVAVMGVINVSPESFHPGSVYRGEPAILGAAQAMVDAGAALIDVGARSTAPYLPTDISVAEETERLVRARVGGHHARRRGARRPRSGRADRERRLRAR